MKNLITKWTVPVLTIMPFMANAHPGHGHENPLSPGHYLANPEHAIPLALVIAVITSIVIWQWKKATDKK